MTLSNCNGFEYACWNCGKHDTFKQPDSSYSCTNCGTLLTPSPKPCYWIFQFNPKVYRWFDRIKETRKPELWLASQHPEYMKKGDFVAIWASGKSAGVYALSRTITFATDMSLNDDDKKYYQNDQAIYKFLYNRSVLIEHFRDLSTSPLFKSQCLEDATLKSLNVLNHQQATNILITTDQWSRIFELTQEI
jgi:hypothetical protein